MWEPTPIQEKRLRVMALTGDFWTGHSRGENGAVLMVCGSLDKLEPIAADLNASIITENLRQDNYRCAFKVEDEANYLKYIAYLYQSRKVPDLHSKLQYVMGSLVRMGCA